MKTIIAGSRDLYGFEFVHCIVHKYMNETGNKISEIVSGHANGIDKHGEYMAECLDVPLKLFPADWEHLGKGAGFIRNKQMAEYADALVAIRLNNSKGTTNMIDTMSKFGKPVYTVDITTNYSG